MARPRLRSPQQRWGVRALLGLWEFCASLKLAVVLIASAAIVLGWATFVESEYGLRAVHFGIYGTWWFTALCALLGVNIFSAAAIRYPWKRHQTGFVITHIGLLTLLFGCLLSRRGGIDAQMPIFEGDMSSRAFEDSEHFELAIYPATQPPSDHRAHADEPAETIAVRFRAGPFNWADYAKKFPIPWRLSSRDKGVLYDRDGVRLEVLDYYSDSREVDAPYLELRMSTPQMPRMGADRREHRMPAEWMPIELHVRQAGAAVFHDRPYGIGDRQTVGGGQIIFWKTGSASETKAFLDSAPAGALGERGQLVLHAREETLRVAVDEKLGKGRFALGGTGLEAELVGYYPTAMLSDDSRTGELRLTSEDDAEAKRPAVEVAIHDGANKVARLILFAGLPELNQQDYRGEVFGTYWFDHGEKTAQQLLEGEGGSRIDILEGQDGKLYYRYWNRKEVVIADRLPDDGTRVDAFKMPIAQLQMYVERHVAADRPEKKVLPLPFAKDQVAAAATRAAHVRLSVDGNTETFWLVGPPAAFLDRPLSSTERRVVAGKNGTGKNRSVAITMPLDEVDVGFQVRLDDFERKLDPGTSQPSHFSSTVDFVDSADRSKYLRRDVWITMNAPVDFSDPATRKSYRLFQEAFRGPFPAGSPVYEDFYRHAPPHVARRDPLMMSVLTVNYDPGRGVKYAGCLLIVAGIVTMFYMRAYFFKPQARSSDRRATRQVVHDRVEPSYASLDA